MIPNAEKGLEDLLPHNEMEGPTFKIKDAPLEHPVRPIPP